MLPTFQNYRNQNWLTMHTSLPATKPEQRRLSEKTSVRSNSMTWFKRKSNLGLWFSWGS